MTPASLQDLADLTEAVKTAQEARLRSLAADETRLRQALADLEESQVRRRNLAPSELSGMQSIGADVLWHAWTSRTRHRLNVQLAQTLARKGDALRALRRAYGRNSAAEALLKTAQTATMREQQKQTLIQQDALGMVQRAQNGPSLGF